MSQFHPAGADPVRRAAPRAEVTQITVSVGQLVVDSEGGESGGRYSAEYRRYHGLGEVYGGSRYLSSE